MKLIAMIVVIIGLVSCGADGEPLTPTANKGLNHGASSGDVSIGAGL